MSGRQSMPSATTDKQQTTNSQINSIKKTKNAKDALKMIDLMDEDSIAFFPVAESPKKKQRMTDKQKDMMMEKKDRLPFMEDESTTEIPKIPSDIFEMSVSGMDSSRSNGAKRGQMKVDFSDMTVEKKSSGNDNSKSSKKEVNKSGEKKVIEKEKKKIVDDFMEESLSSSESMNEETKEEEKRVERRKSKTPKKMIMKTREVRSPSRKKLDASMSVDSPMRKSKRHGKVEEKMDEKKEEEKEIEDIKMSDIPSDDIDDMEGCTSRRSDKITITSMKKGEEIGDENTLIVLDDTPLSSQSTNDNTSPMKSLNEDGDLPIPSTPANRGTFEPVGILSSSKKSKSEKKRGGVHFNVSEKEKIVEVEEEDGEGEKKEEERKDEEEDKNDKMVFPLLRDNDDSIDTITLKLGVNSRLVKMSLEKIGVKTVGQFASMSGKDINGIMGIKPPKMRTVESVLEGVYTRSQKSASKPLPPICTPEKKKESTVSSPKGIEDATPSIVITPPPKSKSRKRLTLSDSPIGVKKMKESEEEMEESIEMEVIGDNEELIGEEKKIEEVDNKKSDVVDKKEVKTIDNEENKENEMDKEKEKAVITSVQDVISFIDHLKKEGSLESLLSAHEQITLSFIEAIRDVRNAQSSK